MVLPLPAHVMMVAGGRTSAEIITGVSVSGMKLAPTMSANAAAGVEGAPARIATVTTLVNICRARCTHVPKAIAPMILATHVILLTTETPVLVSAAELWNTALTVAAVHPRLRLHRRSGHLLRLHHHPCPYQAIVSIGSHRMTCVLSPTRTVSLYI